jgi:hypothetical protein
MTGLWEAIPTPEGSQVVPVDDVIEHELGPDCVCGPEIEHIRPEDATCSRPGGYMTTHHSLDGREANET